MNITQARKELKRGDIKTIAKEVGYHWTIVSKVANLKLNRPKIAEAIIARANARISQSKNANARLQKNLK